MKWIKCSDHLPEPHQSVLVYALVGYHFEGKDNRASKIYICYLYNDNEGFKKLKPKYKWKSDCDCSGHEHDYETIEPLYWMPLPEEPDSRPSS